MGHWLEQYAAWRGRAGDLAELSNVVLDRLKLRKPGVPLNERLVRNYVHRDLLDRPRKAGRDALYGFRHLLQIIGTRVLGQVMSMSSAAEQARKMSEAELLRIIPKDVGEPSLSQQASSLPRPSFEESMQLQKRSLPTEKAIEFVREKMALRSTYGAFPQNEEWVPPKGRSSRTIDVTSWCRITLDEEIFADQPEEAIKMLIRVIASAVDADHQKVLEKYARAGGED